jgi:hypothetical protein
MRGRLNQRLKRDRNFVIAHRNGLKMSSIPVSIVTRLQEDKATVSFD